MMAENLPDQADWVVVRRADLRFLREMLPWGEALFDDDEKAEHVDPCKARVDVILGAPGTEAPDALLRRIAEGSQAAVFPEVVAYCERNMGRWITEEINSDPEEVARLRAALDQLASMDSGIVEVGPAPSPPGDSP